jgi:hypothetical protein
MKPVMGDILKSKTTGEFYKVKKVEERIILLETENIPNKVWLGNKQCLEILYDKVEGREGEKPRFSCLIGANQFDRCKSNRIAIWNYGHTCVDPPLRQLIRNRWLSV